MCPIFMKFSTQNKLNMLIINILIGIDDLNPKLQICEMSQNWNVLQFLCNFALEQMNMLIMNLVLGIEKKKKKSLFGKSVTLVSLLTFGPLKVWLK